MLEGGGQEIRYSKNKVFYNEAMATRPIVSKEASDVLSMCFTGGLHMCNRADLFGMLYTVHVQK